MKKILVPIDFSRGSDNACKYAIEMAKVLHAKITLMHTFETPVIYSEVPMVTSQLDYSILYNSALRELKKYHRKISNIAGKVVIEFLLQQGLASSRITEAAIEKKTDLIIMGTTGKGAVERALMGSNTARVIRNAPCLVMAVPPKSKFKKLKKIVYATDLLSDNLEHAKAIIPLAKIFNSEIIFLHITTGVISDTVEDLDRIRRQIKKHVRYPKFSVYVCNDFDAANGIHNFFKKQDADCLGMYTHHRKLLKTLFSPGITKKVAAHTAVPLLVIHENDF